LFLKIKRPKTMNKKVFSGLLISFLIILSANAQTGQEIFKANCSACHTIGGGKLVGPDLKGITELRQQDWLVRFIKSSMTVINSGDEEAVRIFNEFAKLPMPDQNLTEAQIVEVINYIKSESGSAAAAPIAQAEEKFTLEQVEAGVKYFNGEKTFTSKGPACNSCHSISDKRVYVGGNLAKDLSLTYKNMGAAGIKAILKSPPFPAMTEAYKNHSLTDDEVNSLTAFIVHAGKSPSAPVYGFFGPQFGMYGLLLFVLLNLLIVFYLSKGKKDSVNKEIFKRQLKTH